MNDRVSNHPGRWLLTPVAGQTNVYDFTRADAPTVAGTALNKANLLTDATAAAIAALLGSTPDTPNEALSGLASVLDAMGITNNAKMEITTYVGAGGGYSQNYHSLTFSIKPRFVIWAYPGSNSQWYGEGGNTGLTWVYPYTYGPSYSDSGKNFYMIFDYVENTKTLRWRMHAPTGTGSISSSQWSIWNEDVAGKTYTVIAIGVK